MRNVDGAIIVYDVTSDASFIALTYWINTLRQVADEDTCIYLLGNKHDLISEIDLNKYINKDRVMEFINFARVDYWAECSAKTNYNIHNTFRRFYKGNDGYLDIYSRQRDNLESKTQFFKKMYEKGMTGNPKRVCC